LAVYGIMGIASGSLLIADGSGALLGFTSDYQEKIPFHSFIPVGLFLFFIYGIGSFVLSYGVLTRKELFLEPISKMFKMHWSWTGGMALMAVLVVWLIVEGMLIGLDFAATNFTIAFGAAIFLALLLPSVRLYLKAIVQ